MKTKVAFIIALMVTLFAAVIYVGAQPIDTDSLNKDIDTVFEEVQVDAVSVGVNEPKGATGAELYLIRLSDAPVATYSGGVNSLQATSIEVTGGNKLDMTSASAIAYRDYLLSTQDTLVKTMEQQLGRPVEVAYQYYAANNGMAIRLTPEEAQEVSVMDGVVFVQRDYERELQTDNGPAWIGAPGLWDGSNTGGLPGTKGEGVIVGVIDTGINPSNPSFADVGGDGFDHTNPWGAGNYVGVCDPNDSSYDANFPCNDKLIGAWGYGSVNNGSPIDGDGHGSHTASTAAGNVVTATVIGHTTSITRTISGVAPHANIVMYAACCTGSALTAAIDQIVIDGVDVVNYSIGSSSPSDVWGEFDTVGYLNARAAGIFVATSAGNDGPGDETLGSPADAPWLTSVGATTHDRAYPNSLINISGSVTTTADIEGKGFTAGYGPAPIVYAGDYPNANDPTGDPAQCLQPYPAGTWTNGEIVVCDRGAIARTAKGFNVQAGGAGGFVLANAQSNGDSLSGDDHYLPAVHITYADGVVLKAWLANGDTNQVATITGSTMDIDPANGDIMAAFSSRGANRALPDMIGPSISAPGVDILAAYGTGDVIEWGMISGTSMASPHVAGAAALLVALHPEWSPAEVQSAMMLTSETDILDDDETTPATPFAMGNGRIDLNFAAEAGFVMNETKTNYLAANPADGGDPKTLNLPSMGNAQCLSECSWTRTISSTQAVSVTWNTSATNPLSSTITVEPATFVLDAYGTQVITITADVSAADTGVWAFGQAVLTTTASLPDAHLAVAAKPTNGVFPDFIEIGTRRDAGSMLVEDIQSIEVTDFTASMVGLVEADLGEFTLDEDPTNGDPYDNLNDVFWMTMTVPANTYSLIAEIKDTTAPDLDLYVGMGATPSAATEECKSASGGSAESCIVDSPATGTWWVLVQSWAESSTPPDPVLLATAVVVDADAGNSWATGPMTATKGTPYDVRIYWDGITTENSYWYGYLRLGSDAATPGNIGDIPVFLTRYADDVTKVSDRSTAPVDGIVKYTIQIQPNFSGEDMVYTITDTIPAGMTYISGTLTGGATITGNTITWSDTMPGTYKYNMTTSDNDPMCDTGFGGYVNLEAFGIATNPNISGDTEAWTSFSTGLPFSYYGIDYTGFSFTDDGFAVLDAANNYAGAPWTPQTLPDPAFPNNVIAPLWQDMEVFYDGPSNMGVSLASAGSNVVIVEYDNIQFWGGSADNWDFEIVALRQPVNAPGNYEYVIAYDNLNGDLTGPLTVGIENAAGDQALALVNHGDASGVLSDGFMICYDWAGPTESHTITYWAKVDSGVASGTILTNTASHAVDNIGSAVVDVDVPVEVVDVAYGVDLSDNDAGKAMPGETVTYMVTITNTGNVTDTFDIVTIGTWDTPIAPITLLWGETSTMMVDVNIPMSAPNGSSATSSVSATSQGDPMESDVTILTTTVEIFYTFAPIVVK